MITKGKRVMARNPTGVKYLATMTFIPAKLLILWI
jgi:hypothetical protein